MSEEPAGDKSFEATPERLRKARAKGDVAVSPEVAVLASYAGLLLGAVLAGGALLRAAERLTGAFAHPEAFGAAALQTAPTGLSEAGTLPTAALIAPAAALVLAGLIVQGAVVFAPSKIKPDFKKVSPVSNAKKKYGAAGMGEFARSAVKITGVTLLGGAYLWARRDGYLALTGAHPGVLPELLRGEVTAILGLGCVVAVLAAVVDLPFRRMRHASRLKMTRQEVQDETKETEGSPDAKQNRKRRAGEIARNAMLCDAGEADVVIVNPTHYAVALRWDRSSETVPVCVAKGTDHLALAIRDRAAMCGVPVRRDVDAARALHATVAVGETIRPEHYAAVAAAIRFAEGARRRAR